MNSRERRTRADRKEGRERIEERGVGGDEDGLEPGVAGHLLLGQEPLVKAQKHISTKQSVFQSPVA